MNQQGSPCYDRLKWLSERYDSKVNSVGQLDGKKLAASVLLYVFIIGFPASPLSPDLPPKYLRTPIELGMFPTQVNNNKHLNWRIASNVRLGLCKVKAWKKGEFCKVRSNHREGLLPTKLCRLVLFCIHLEVPGEDFSTILY